MRSAERIRQTLTNQLNRLLGIKEPIVLAPFGGLSSVELTAIVSQLGGLGSYGLYGYSPDRIRETVDQTRAATDQPFAVNLWLPTGTERDPEPEEFDRYVAALIPFFEQLRIAPPELPDRYLPSFEDQIQTVLELAPPVISFVYGIPPSEVVAEAHRHGSLIVGTATTVDEAVALEEGGVDVIVATGAEAAGHRVSFLEPAECSLVGGIALIPQVVDAVSVPEVSPTGEVSPRLSLLVPPESRSEPLSFIPGSPPRTTPTAT